MPNARQSHPNAHLQEVLSARKYITVDQDRSIDTGSTFTDTIASNKERANIVSSPIAPSTRTRSSLTKKVDKDTPKPMVALRSRLHARRSAGRPRLGATGEAILSESRRDQVRRAQRTYRLKREATLEKAQKRAADLEDRLARVAVAIAEYKASIPTDLKASHPALLRHLDFIDGLAKLDDESPIQVVSQRSTPSSSTTGKNNVPSQDNGMPIGQSTAGTIEMNCDCLDDNPTKKPMKPFADRLRKRTQHVSLDEGPEQESNSAPVRIHDMTQLQRSDAPHTYSFQETEFYRKLQRYCLEYAFRLFSDSRSNPLDVYRVFRLVPCIQNRTKMYPFFRKLVTAGVKDALEISNLPFYSIGGAGTHYPKKDVSGNPIYPGNTRTPKRILGLFKTSEARNEYGQEMDYQKLLDVYGYGGEWFDCRDVEGYLREQGVHLDDSISFPYLQYRQTYLQSPKAHEDDDANTSCDEVMPLPEPSKSRMIDIEQFFSRLLHGVVILGRAPAFRRTDVANAYKSALRMQVY
ncbi:hypothetical protein TCE0_043r15685 [Talaromyces pinophilus]|uniref:BZIP transcription factor n=1 Tax=Talaromyces pinophilus TaxID=128442 RepID=A0A0B8N5X2_TALPI|nr:hypothetical protein TCE0_043r15685 [Talaromyces pinophilus]